MDLKIPEIRSQDCSRCFVSSQPGGLFYCSEANCWSAFCHEHVSSHLKIHNGTFLKLVTDSEGQYKARWTSFKTNNESQVDSNWLEQFTRVRTVKEKAAIGSDWMVALQPCEHTLMLQQDQQLGHVNLNKCLKCELTNNLWLCLHCGSVGCGRRQFDGSGGNNHGHEHYLDCREHPVAIKLGTLTHDGKCDLYCYACDDMRLDPDLPSHLFTYGILLEGQVVTEKTLEELQLEQNLNFDFNMATNDGVGLEPVYGPLLTGLKNIGNSCYMSSVLQSIASLPFVSDMARKLSADHYQQCKVQNPLQCITCQFFKAVNGLSNGVWSKPSQSNDIVESSDTLPDELRDLKEAIQLSKGQVDNHEEFGERRWQDGLSPFGFKNVVAQGDKEFESTRQQDAYEYFQLLLTKLDQDFKSSFPDQILPSQYFTFKLSSRVECTQCHHVSYSEENSTGLEVPVPQISTRSSSDDSQPSTYQDVSVSQCLAKLQGLEIIQDFNCPVCKKKVEAQRDTKFKLSEDQSSGHPPVLIMHMQRFILDNWVPKKLNLSIDIDTESLDLSGPQWIRQPPAVGELQMPSEVDSHVARTPNVDETALEQLMSMGFSKNRATRSLQVNQGSVEQAMEWLLTKIDDATLDAPLDVSVSQSPSADPRNVQNLQEMGFTAAQAKKALRVSKNNMESAVEWLFANSGDAGDEEPNLSQPIQNFKNLSSRYRLHSIIAHKGSNVNSGHYVAYVRYRKPAYHVSELDQTHPTAKEGDWILFNDEKVVHYRNGVLHLQKDGFAVDKDVGNGYILVWVNEQI